MFGVPISWWLFIAVSSIACWGKNRHWCRHCIYLVWVCIAGIRFIYYWVISTFFSFELLSVKFNGINHHLVFEHLTLFKIICPYYRIKQQSLSITVQPALHNCTTEIIDCCAEHRLTYPWQASGSSSGQSMSHLCIDWILLPSDMTTFIGFEVGGSFLTFDFKVMKMPVVTESSMQWIAYFINMLTCVVTDVNCFLLSSTSVAKLRLLLLRVGIGKYRQWLNVTFRLHVLILFPTPYH